MRVTPPPGDPAARGKTAGVPVGGGSAEGEDTSQVGKGQSTVGYAGVARAGRKRDGPDAPHHRHPDDRMTAAAAEWASLPEGLSARGGTGYPARHLLNMLDDAH